VVDPAIENRRQFHARSIAYQGLWRWAELERKPSAVLVAVISAGMSVAASPAFQELRIYRERTGLLIGCGADISWLAA